MNKLISRRQLSTLIATCALGFGLVAGTTMAQADYPEKPVTLVIPYKAGGSTETMARIFSIALAKELAKE